MLMKTVERDSGVVSAPPVDMPQRLKSREYGFFFHDFIPYFISLAGFLSFKCVPVVNNTFFYVVTNSEHTFNIDFNQRLPKRLYLLLLSGRLHVSAPHLRFRSRPVLGVVGLWRSGPV